MEFLKTLLMVLLFVTAIFLIVLVLIQRGKGGGLAGAFGGMGGQSAFGTKAGDLFTRITIGAAAFWIVLCIITVKVLAVGTQGPLGGSKLGSNATDNKPAVSAAPEPGKKTDGGKGASTPAPAKTSSKKTDK
jgi:preprotein translocase subunit SecG